MSTPPNAMSGAAVDSQTAAPALASTTHPFYWSVRRELWENRSLYLAPLIVAGVIVIGFMFSAIGLAERRRAVLLLDDPLKQRTAIEMPYSMAAMMIMFTAFIVAVFYSGVGAGALWSRLPLWPTTVTLFNHLIFVHGLWYAPFYCWLLLVSAWARRMAFLWAVIPVLTLNALEKVALNTSHFASILSYRLLGAPHHAHSAGYVSMDPLDTAPAMELLATPGLWIGLIVAAIFLAMAVRLRRYREPM